MYIGSESAVNQRTRLRFLRPNCHLVRSSPILSSRFVPAGSSFLAIVQRALAFLVAARFADPIVSLPPYQFARERSDSELRRETTTRWGRLLSLEFQRAGT